MAKAPKINATKNGAATPDLTTVGGIAAGAAAGSLLGPLGAAVGALVGGVAGQNAGKNSAKKSAASHGPVKKTVARMKTAAQQTKVTAKKALTKTMASKNAKPKKAVTKRK